MTGTVITGQHGEDAVGGGQGLEDSLVSCGGQWGATGRLKSRAEAGVAGLAPQASPKWTSSTHHP